MTKAEEMLVEAVMNAGTDLNPGDGMRQIALAKEAVRKERDVSFLNELYQKSQDYLDYLNGFRGDSRLDPIKEPMGKARQTVERLLRYTVTLCGQCAKRVPLGCTVCADCSEKAGS